MTAVFLGLAMYCLLNFLFFSGNYQQCLFIAPLSTPRSSFRSPATSSLLIAVVSQVALPFVTLKSEHSQQGKTLYQRACFKVLQRLPRWGCLLLLYLASCAGVVIDTGKHHWLNRAVYMILSFHFLIYFPPHILLIFLHNQWRLNILYMLLFSFPSCELFTLKAFICIALFHSHHFVKFTL